MSRMLFLLRLSYNLMKYGSTKNATSITKVNCKVKTRFAKYKKMSTQNVAIRI